MAERRCPRRADRGSAAVEFALVVPILLALLFGIVDYGLYFSSSLSATSGVQEAARQGVVKRCNTMRCLADLVRVEAAPVAGGDTYVKINVIRNPPNPNRWSLGNDLRVCVIVAVDGITGLTPLPAGGTTRARVTMRIEQDDPPRPGGSFQDPLPSGVGDWSFCA